jgi:hypothetical protein
MSAENKYTEPALLPGAGHGRRIRHALDCLILPAALLLMAAASPADVWPPSDPDDGIAAVEITTAWTKELREARALADVQRAAGARGKIESFETKGDTARAVFTWVGRDGKGRLRVLLYRSGGFAAIVDPTDTKGNVVMNSFGAFNCRACSPPVDACGRRPSWIPHDVHWDTFDCPRTITGPQDMPVGD